MGSVGHSCDNTAGGALPETSASVIANSGGAALVRFSRLGECLPPEGRVIVRVGGAVDARTSVEDAHGVWRNVDRVATPEGPPRQPSDARCPEGVVRVTVDAWNGSRAV